MKHLVALLSVLLVLICAVARAEAPAPAKARAPAASAQAPAAGADGEEQAPPNPHVQNPHAQNPHGQQPAPDQSDEAADLPPGTLEVAIVDGTERALPGVDVRLGILSQKISEGEQRSSKNAKTDAEGHTRFPGLVVKSEISYRVTVQAGGALYESSPFTLRDNAGHRVLLHVYQATADLSRTVLGMRGFCYVETRDDVFQLEVLFRIINIGKTSWVPADVVMELPQGWKAFSPGESMYDARFEPVEGRGAALRGTFPPGQRDVSFRFQIPKPTESAISFTLGMLPNVVEMRVIAVASPEMNLEVSPGFEVPQVAAGPRGDRVLVTRRVAQKNADTSRTISVALSGLHVPGPGRWVAVCIALVFAGFGVLAASGELRIASTERVQGDRGRARELILRELVLVERAKAAGDIGPNAYERAHRALLDALARIGVPEEKKRKKTHSARA
jgi:hypothetical protein